MSFFSIFTETSCIPSRILTLSSCALVLELLVVGITSVRARHVKAVPIPIVLDNANHTAPHIPIRTIGFYSENWCQSYQKTLPMVNPRPVNRVSPSSSAPYRCDRFGSSVPVQSQFLGAIQRHIPRAIPISRMRPRRRICIQPGQHVSFNHATPLPSGAIEPH